MVLNHPLLDVPESFAKRKVAVFLRESFPPAARCQDKPDRDGPGVGVGGEDSVIYPSNLEDREHDTA